MRLKHVLAAIILVLSFAAPVIAGPADDALDAFVNHDYATALTLFHRAADQGDANGFFMLGVMSIFGATDRDVRGFEHHLQFAG